MKAGKGKAIYYLDELPFDVNIWESFKFKMKLLFQIVGEETYYKVKWIGSKKETWEPEENMIGCQDAIDNFLVEEKTRLRYVYSA